MADVYGPTLADLKLPGSSADIRGKVANAVGLKYYDGAVDGLIQYNVAGDIATGTGTNVTTQKQSYYDSVSDAKAVNTSLLEQGHNRVAMNNDNVYNTVYLPNS